MELHTLELAAVYKMALVIAEERGLVEFCTRGPNLRVGLTKAGWEYVRMDFHTPVVINTAEGKAPQYASDGQHALTLKPTKAARCRPTAPTPSVPASTFSCTPGRCCWCTAAAAWPSDTVCAW